MEPWELKKETMPIGVKGCSLCFCRPHGLEKCLVFKKGSIGNRPVDADPVGKDLPAGADVEVAGFGIADGAFRQADGFS